VKHRIATASTRDAAKTENRSETSEKIRKDAIFACAFKCVARNERSEIRERSRGDNAYPGFHFVQSRLRPLCSSGLHLLPLLGITDMSATLELSVYLEKDGTRQPFYLRISEPRSVAGAEDFSCLIHAPLLFKSDKTIMAPMRSKRGVLRCSSLNRWLRAGELPTAQDSPLSLESCKNSPHERGEMLGDG
jgi:hypothetical protein